MSACIYHHWEEKNGQYFFLSWHLTFLFSYLFILPVPCFHQNWRIFFISYNSFLADSEAACPTSTHLAFQKGRQEDKGVGEEDKICAWALLWDGVRRHLGSWTLENTLLLLVSNSWPLWPCEEKDGSNSTEISVHGKHYAAIILCCPCYLGSAHPPDNQPFQHQYLLNIFWQKYQDFLI